MENIEGCLSRLKLKREKYKIHNVDKNKEK